MLQPTDLSVGVLENITYKNHYNDFKMIQAEVSFNMFGSLGATEILQIVLSILGIALLIGILYIATLQKALNRCSIDSRTISPGSVWLLLIPFFNIVWQFVLVSKISESLHNEFTKRNINADPQPGKSIGLAYCILSVGSIIPVLGGLTSLASFICWIIYWYKISGYSEKLEQPVLA